MLKFFRQIRQRLLQENRFSKYLLYALGEIALVVIGILIALQINTWNEEQKIRRQEKSLLVNLKAETLLNIDQLKFILLEKEKTTSNIELVLQYTRNPGSIDQNVNLDSILYPVIVSGWKYFPIDGLQNDILNSGKLDIISNDSLRYYVSSLPQFWKLLSEEEEFHRRDLHGNYLPFFIRNYSLRNISKYNTFFEIDIDLGRSGFHFDRTKLLNDPEFENILTAQLIWMEFAIHFQKDLLNRYLRILDLINIELNEY